MDTSEQYIKMCDCPEIQDGWKLELGDVFSCDSKARVYYGQRIPKDSIFLPRQDRLQGMVFDETVGLQSQCCAIWNFSTAVESQLGAIIIHGTMEQLWLAFVINELHGKKWDGEQWK